MRQKKKFILSHFWLGQNVGEEGEEGRKEEEEEEEEGEGEEDQTKVCFVLKTWVFWDS